MNEIEFENYKNIIKNKLSKNRYNHSISVAFTAANLGFIHNENIDKCLIAGLLHDICKELNIEEFKKYAVEYNINLTEEDISSPQVLHGIIGSYYLKNNFNIQDEEILLAVKNHTIGRENMTKLEKIIYIADFIEPLRKNLDCLEEIRKMAYENLNKTVYLIAYNVYEYLKEKNIKIHSKTLATINYYKDKI